MDRERYPLMHWVAAILFVGLLVLADMCQSQIMWKDWTCAFKTCVEVKKAP